MRGKRAKALRDMVRRSNPGPTGYVIDRRTGRIESTGYRRRCQEAKRNYKERVR